MNRKTTVLGMCLGFLFGGLISLSLATTFSYTLDCASPLGTDSPSSIDDKIRETRYGFQERMNVDHYFALTGTAMSDEDTGYHRSIHFYSTTAVDPILGVTAVGGIDELQYTDSASSTLQLTSAGTLNIVSADLLGTLANNTYFTAVDNAGTGTVDLIKANASDVAVLPDASELASSAAPTSDADIANKKYVDDQIVSEVVHLTAASATVFNTTHGASDTFQDLDLSGTVGSNSALVFLEIKCSGNATWNAKPNGQGGVWARHAIADGGCTQINFDAADDFGYATILTDTGGLIEHGSSDATKTFTIKILGYIVP